MLKVIFMWIYRMDFHEALILLAAFTGLFYAAKVKFCQHRIWKFAVILVLLIWAVSVVIQTLFQRTPNASLYPIWLPFQSYVDALKEGGQKELLRSNFMNAVLFYTPDDKRYVDYPARCRRCIGAENRSDRSLLPA